MGELLEFINGNQGALLLTLIVVNVYQATELRDWRRRITALEEYVYPAKKESQ